MIIEDVFASSTFWTERIGYVAALATLNEMKRLESWKKITETGNYIIKEWKNISKYYELNVNFYGIPALPSFTFQSKNHLAYKTYISQEMQKQQIIASNLIYVSTAHNKKIIDEYIYKCHERIK